MNHLSNITTKTRFNPFKGPTIETVIPIIESQAEIWSACKLGGDDASRAYNDSISLLLKGELDVGALESALTQLIQRHESLRAVFSENGQYMCIYENSDLSLAHLDVSHLKTKEKEKAVADYLFKDVTQTFDLVQGPLYKIGLIKESDYEHRLVITTHHIICDGWSVGIIIEELSSLYSSFIKGETTLLPTPEFFSEYADEQHQLTGSDVQKATEDFWCNLYKSNVPEVSLPTDFPRPSLRTFKSERQDFLLNQKLLGDIKKVGIDNGCSLVTALLAAFEVFLFQQIGQEDIVVGLPSAGQSMSGKYQLVGHCVNLLPIRTKISSDLPFKTYLTKRKIELFDAYDHHNLSFGQLLQKLSIARDPSRVPLVPVVFNIDVGMGDQVKFEGLTFEIHSNPRAFETFELFLNASGTEEALTLEWSYNASLFKPETIEQMMVSFETILQEIAANPNSLIGEISKVDVSAYLELNNTKAAFPNLTLHQLFSEQAKKTPLKTALRFEDEKISYRDLDMSAHRLAHYLVQKGVHKSDFVGVLLPRSFELVFTLMAIMESGSAYLPLDSIYPHKRLEFMLKDSEAEYIISTRTLSSKLQCKAKFLYLEDILPELSKYPSTPIDLEWKNERTAYLLYTSGSTGKPKGVQVSHRSLVNLLHGVLKNPGIEESDILVSITTISFDIAAVELFGPLLTGATLVLAPDESTRDTRLLLELIRKEKVTIMQATPATWQMLLDSGWEDNLSIKAISTGEALPLALSKKIVDKVDSLWNLYGPTETTIWASIKKILPSDESISIGKPIPNTQMYIVNEEGDLVPPGQIGELCIAGQGVATGYFKRPQLTSEKFVENPFNSSSDTKLYKTGDLAKLLPSGEIECLGRIDHQVKIRGYRIELGEIEQALNSLENVQSSVVLLHENRLVANIIMKSLKNHNAAAESTWLEDLKNFLPDYMIPHRFNVMEEFPITLNGKIDRITLAKGLSGGYSKKVQNKPSTKFEKIIASIWKDCLKLKSMDVDSDFFELGGHSLIGNKAMALLEKETGQRVPLVSLLKYPTVRKLAAFMDQELFEWNSLVPLKPEGNKPPLYIVHGANHHVLIFNELAQSLDAEQPVFGLQSRGLDGKTEPHDSIDKMAADYVSEILASNPKGPYALAGFSYGGIVALEMARQLKELGKEVKILAQFDTYVFPEYYVSSPFQKRIIAFFYLISKLFFMLFNMFTSKKNFYRRIELIILRLKGIGLRLKYGKERQHEMQFNVPLKLTVNHDKATSEYHIRPIDMTIDLFRATEEVNLVHDHKYLGWKNIASGGIRKHMVLGNHVDMFEKPQVGDFAALLQNVLDKYSSKKL